VPLGLDDVPDNPLAPTVAVTVTVSPNADVAVTASDKTSSGMLFIYLSLPGFIFIVANIPCAVSVRHDPNGLCESAYT
jgi:hypothetical protein